MKRSRNWLIVDAMLLVAALVVIFLPEYRKGFMQWAVVSLFFVVTVPDVIAAYRRGELSKTFAEIAKNPPRTHPLQFLAAICGAIGVFLVL